MHKVHIHKVHISPLVDCEIQNCHSGLNENNNSAIAVKFGHMDSAINRSCKYKMVTGEGSNCSVWHSMSKIYSALLQVLLQPAFAGSPLLFISWPLSPRPRFGAMSGRSGPPPMKFGNPGERLRKKRWNLDELPKFEKNFYVEHPEVQHMSQVNLYISLFPSHSKTISDSINLYEKLESMTKIHKPTNINKFKPLNNKVESCLIIISYLKKNIHNLYTLSKCMFSVFSSLWLLCPVWNGRISQEEGDHHQRLWLSKGDHCFSPAAVSSLVNHT